MIFPSAPRLTFINIERPRQCATHKLRLTHLEHRVTPTIISKESRMKFVLRSILTILFVAPAAFGSVRCAFDVGSGETKMVAADADFTALVPKLKILAAQKAPVPFKAKLEANVIPEKLIQTAITTINEMKKVCLVHKATEFSGVGTSVFRAAKNGTAALATISQATGTHLKVISSDTEGELSFLSVENNYPDSRPILVWDIGGGSSQFSFRLPLEPTKIKTISLKDPLDKKKEIGSASFRKNLVDRFGNDFDALDFVQVVEAGKYATSIVAGETELKTFIKNNRPHVIGVGGTHTESLRAQAADGKAVTYRLGAVQKALKENVGVNKAQIKTQFPENGYPESQVTNVILVEAILNHLDVQEVTTDKANLANGLLLAAEFWK
jgi:exopolyphosphatase/pppGpp-phosphohydrolase